MTPGNQNGNQSAVAAHRHADAALPAGDLLEIIRTLPDVVFRCEKRANGKIYWTLNEGRLAEEFHVTTAEIEGKSLEELFPGGASEAMMDHFERAFRGEAHEFINEMGGRHFKHYPQPVFDAAGEVVAVVGFITEVTTQIRAQQEIQKLTEELAKRVIDLAQANDGLEAFNYTLSHDLRTPLSVIQTQCHLIEMAEKKGDAAGVLERVAKVREAGLKMGDLIESVLTLSHATREPLQTQEVEMSALAETVIEDLSTTEPDREVQVDIQGGVKAWGDPKLLYQVLANLLGNAWKYTGEVASPVIRFGARTENRRTVYYVGDNGRGFDVAQSGGLFEPFTRLPGAKGFKGTGIGLATVRKILERHGGQIWADAKPGEGATFYFTLGTKVPYEAPAQSVAKGAPRRVFETPDA